MRKSKRSAKQMPVLLLALAVFACGLALPGRSEVRTARGSAEKNNTASRPQPRQSLKVNGAADSSRSQSTQSQQDNSKEDKSHVPDPPGRIAFASDRDGDFEIYIMDPDGGGLVKITDHPAEDLSPTWSPDGARLAFVSNRDGNKEIYAVNADGSGLTRLTNNKAEDLDPAWSPQIPNQKIAFVTHRNGNDEIYTMNPNGKGLVNLTKNSADDNSPAWAPSGTLLSFASNRDGDKYEIYRMTSTGTNQTRLTINGANDASTTWPSGRITFQTDRDGNDEIYTMNVDGTNQIRITNNAAFDLDPARAPDGARLAFVSNRDAAANLEIYAANADGSGVTRLTNNPASDIDPAIQPLPSATTLGTIQFGAATLTVSEGQVGINIGVTRTGGTGAAFVDIATVNGTALDRTDFTPIFLTTVTFASGQTSKTVHIPVINDVFIEGNETFSVTLSGPVNAVLGSPNTAVVTITDNDTVPPTTNPIDNTQFFIRQHYLDFLNREPEPAGFNGWVNILNNCPSGSIACDRIEVSSAFYRSDEFQVRGYFIYRFFAAALGRIPQYTEFMTDLARVTGFLNNQQLEENKVDFIDDFMNRPEFKNKYDPTINKPASYVNLLSKTAGVTLSNKQALITGLQTGTETRATVLRKFVESPEVTTKFFKEAFVVEAYFGYLRRNPDALFANWIQIFNQTNDYRVIVNGFVNSVEYRQRFGP